MRQAGHEAFDALVPSLLAVAAQSALHAEAACLVLQFVCEDVTQVREAGGRLSVQPELLCRMTGECYSGRSGCGAAVAASTASRRRCSHRRLHLQQFITYQH